MISYRDRRAREAEIRAAAVAAAWTEFVTRVDLYRGEALAVCELREADPSYAGIIREVGANSSVARVGDQMLLGADHRLVMTAGLSAPVAEAGKKHLDMILRLVTATLKGHKPLGDELRDKFGTERMELVAMVNALVHESRPPDATSARTT